ncbi:c-type cytochrome [Ammoniphilus resinae]|uniref:Cytochrome c551 n=1 Tax=Ammoniphilus resinae TaxID=861532 RepID=A0ABS4GK85_9BACL|nr:cytochrome c [Ammoniphilus resinae]MBP1930634.1 cytochrome c551 [Ammoniphilus resinae]
MDKTVRALVGILAGGLVIGLGLAFSGAGVPKEGEQQEAAAQAPTAEEIQSTVQSTCTACHGADLNGSAGPNLHNLDQKYSKEEIVDILANGKGGMPKGLVPGNEEYVADYLLTLKQ